MPAVLANEAYLSAIIAPLVLIILVGRGMNMLFVRLGQPGALGEIVGGLMLGPSLLGALAPAFHAGVFTAETGRTLFVIGQIGLILLMFEIGADFEFGHLKQRRHARAVGLIAAVSVMFPFLAGAGIGRLSHPVLAPDIDRILYALFCGVALAITAVPILGRILREYGLNRTPVGVVAIAAAALNDVAGWLILAVSIGSKILPCYLAARVSGFSKPESWLLGGLMNTRALMDLIVLNIAYDLGFLPQKMFTMLVFMAIITTMMTGPLIRMILPRMGLPLPDKATSGAA